MQTNTISAFLAATAPPKDPVVPTDHFSRVMAEYLPEGVALPSALIRTFNWLEGQGCYHVLQDGEGPEDYILSLYPLDEHDASDNISMVAFHPETPSFSQDWAVPDPAIDARVLTLATISSDGARVVMWIDDHGQIWFALLGKKTLGIISDNPLVLLQFLALGYLEPGMLRDCAMTPLQEALEHQEMGGQSASDAPFIDVAPTIPPSHLQSFLKREFKLTLPETARDLGIADFTFYGDPDSDDPFVNWVASLNQSQQLVHPETIPAALAPETEVQHIGNLDDAPNADLEEKPKGAFATVKGWFGR
jgi:hypothetical protein